MKPLNKVKLISADNVTDLTCEINKFLESNKFQFVNLRDIKYLREKDRDKRFSFYCAFILYEIFT